MKAKKTKAEEEVMEVMEVMEENVPAPREVVFDPNIPENKQRHLR